MDWSQYRHHCTWLQTLRIREDRVVSSVFQLGVSMLLTTVSFLLLFGFGTNCRLLSSCPLTPRPSSLDWRAPRRLRHQFRDIRPVFISHSSTFLSVCLCLWNLDLSFACCTSCTSAMHDITQLWGMCIIGKEERKFLTENFSGLGFWPPVVVVICNNLSTVHHVCSIVSYRIVPHTDLMIMDCCSIQDQTEHSILLECRQSGQTTHTPKKNIATIWN